MTRRAMAIVALVAAASLGGWRIGEARRAATVARVVEVVDGDTIRVVRSGRGAAVETLRLLGVDTPETVHPERPVECFGPEASAFTRRVLSGKVVRLEFDVERRDAYGRILAFVHVDGRRFNDELVRRGYATLLIVPPNGRHGRPLLDAEFEARRAGRGLWGSCGESHR